MEHRYENGKIIVSGKFYEEAVYHVSNDCMSAVFNGKGTVTGYALANDKSIMKGNISYFRSGEAVEVYLNKTVEMAGRCQITDIDLQDGRLTVKQFVDSSVNGVFASYAFKSDKKDDAIEVAYGGMPPTKEFEAAENEISYDGVIFGADTAIEYAKETRAAYFTVKAGETVHTFLSCGEKAVPSAAYIKDFAEYEKKMQAEFDRVIIPDGLSEEQKALFINAYFCAYENYKVLGDYKAFMAGHIYLLPMRSYYRDSYYTVLPMYRQHSDLVRNQIITLARGISENGDCPSAVRWDYSGHWGNHYDSPSFPAMMLWDYVKYTNDTAILSEKINNTTVLGRITDAVEKLASFADETGLIYKKGRYNMRDWADEVCRSGYVTYNEVLFARALYSLSKLYELTGDGKLAAEYMTRFEKVKQAVNHILWDDELGWYVNFKDGDFTEKNLSVDTCFAALFGIAEGDRAVRMLKNMESILESKNNPDQKAGDFGVMCVYPFYSRKDGARHKSSQPYYYHNGANWPYLSAMYAAAKRKFGMEYRYALESWFEYNVERGNYTPVEFFSPPQPDGSLLQAWSGAAAFVIDEEISVGFWD